MDEYYRWLVDLVCDDYYIKYYSKLLNDLYEREFIWSINRDEDRAIDGMGLRNRYCHKFKRTETRIISKFQEGCSVLEVMAALAIRIENEYMHDSRKDINNTKEWFWNMVISLGLDRNDDCQYDHDRTVAILDAFIERRYRRDGKGSLFMIENLDKKLDMAELDIWTQMNWYIDSLTDLKDWLE